MLSSASSANQRRSLRPNKRHKSSHHRGRTARTRRKKAWSEFSRWEGDSSDNDFSDLLHFCQTRGLTRAATAPPQRTACSSSNEAKDTGNKKVLNSQVACNGLDKAEDSKYISLLCSSLNNKLKFLHESEYHSTESLNVEESEKENSENLNNVGKSHEVTLSLKTSRNPANNNVQSSLNVEKSSTSSTSSETTEKSNSTLLPKIQFQSETEPTQQGENPDLGLPSTKTVTATCNFVDNSPCTSLRRSVKEWTAEVETDVMRLYESGEPGASLSILDSKPLPLKLAQVKEQVEAKLSSADHTPSYVLALANLFRRRMQIRKEFSQASGEMTNTTLKDSAMSPRCHNNVFPLHNTKTTLPRQQGSGENSSIALRYHHMTNHGGEAACQNCQSNSTPATANLKPQNTAYCSISSPLQHDWSKQNMISFASLEENNNMKPLLENPTLSIEQSGRTGVSTEEILPPTNSVAALPALSDGKESLPKLSTLGELLTVFPKPPRFKFEGFQMSSDRHREIYVSSNNKLFGSFRKNRGSLLKQDNKHANESKDVLVVSIATSLRKNLRSNKIPREKQNTNQLQKYKRTMTTLPKPRQCSSALPIFPKSYHSLGLHPQQQTNNFCTNDSNHDNPNDTRHPHSFEKRQSIDDDLGITLVPVSKVRWSGSLGTLYKKPQLFTDSAEQKSKSAISNVSVNKLSSICDAHVGSGGAEIGSNYNSPAESMKPSSLEKQSAIARG